MDIVEAPVLQRLRDQHAASTMQRRIDDLQVVLMADHLGVNADGLDLLQIGSIHISTHHLDEVVVAFKLHIGDRDLAHLVDDALVMGSKHLCAILPIGLVAIILARVVAGGEVHTSLRAKMADGKGALGRGAHLVEEIDLDAVGREDIGHRAGVEIGVVAAVVAHHRADLLPILEVLLQIIGKSLGCHSDGIDVHTVGACAHNAAQTACSKFKSLVERVNQLRLVWVLHHGLYFLLRLLVVEG